MSLHDEKAAALAEGLAATGEPIVWKGRTLHALVSDNPLSQDLGLGGFEAKGDCTMKVLRSELGADQPMLASAYWFRHVAAHPFFDTAKEHLAIILLNTKNRTIGWNLVSIGSLNESLAHPREIFRPAIAVAASAFILMHNHPSGESQPSDADRRLTTRIEEAARLLQIRFLDHVIVGAQPSDVAFSFRQSGFL